MLDMLYRIVFNVVETSAYCIALWPKWLSNEDVFIVYITQNRIIVIELEEYFILNNSHFEQ